MTSRMMIFLLELAFISLCFAQAKPTPLDNTFKGTITHEASFIANFSVLNLDDAGATLTVTHSHDLVICVVVKMWGLPNYTAYSIDNCAYWKRINATDKPEADLAGNFSVGATTTSTVNFALLNREYTIGFFIAGTWKEHENTTDVTARLTGSQCPKNQYWNFFGKTCVAAKTAPAVGKEFSELFTPSVPYFWKFSAPADLGSFSIEAKNPAVRVSIYLRYLGSPNAASYDAKGTNTATFDFPRPGDWIIGLWITGKKTSQVAFTVKGDDCSKKNATGGPACKVEYDLAHDDFKLVAKRDSFHYFKFVATPKQGLRVSVTTSSMKVIPIVLASRGQLPTDDSHDIANCNTGYCSEVKSIYRNVTTDEVWYIGIKAQKTEQNTTAGVWWNSTCVPGCDEGTRGTCLDSGFCKCDPSFTGVDCMISQGLAPQYIVLIIIASLVVASAFIGFVAWAYMRQKRAHYDKI